MSVYIDTSAFLAILDADDSHHATAAHTWSDLIDSNEQIITTNYVVVEIIALLHRRFGALAVGRLQMDMLPVVNVEWVDEGTHSVGISTVLASSKRGPSFVDCVSFEIMRKMTIRNAFAYDKHFQDQGFQLIG